jgi:hypothetical protein
MDRAQEVGLFRWQLIGEAVDPSLSSRERGLLVRSLAAREHRGPDGGLLTFPWVTGPEAAGSGRRG